MAVLALALGGCGSRSESSGPPEQDDAFPSLPPFPVIEGAYVFRFSGLTPEQIEPARKHPDYKIKDLSGGVTQVVFTPPPNREFREERFGEPRYAEYLFNMLFIPGPLGKTRGDSGFFNALGWGGTAFLNPEHWLKGSVGFTDFSSGNSETMLVHAVLGVTSQEVEHDMLRYIAGTKVVTETFGEHGVLVSGNQQEGHIVAWQISPQAYVRIYNCYDKGMVAAYVDRLGSITPRDYRVDPDRWVRDEIISRIRRTDWDIRHRGWDVTFVAGAWSCITTTFPNVFLLKGMIKEGMTPEEVHGRLKWAREWLWANRENFTYNDRSRGFMLKGPDRYDPEHPPELPEEMRGLPPP